MDDDRAADEEHATEQWDVSVEDLNSESEGRGDADEESDGNVAGAFRPTGDIEPGRPSLENALFVVAGAYIAVLALTRMFVDPAGFSTRDLLVLTGGTLALAAVAFVFYGFVPGRDPET